MEVQKFHRFFCVRTYWVFLSYTNLEKSKDERCFCLFYATPMCHTCLMNTILFPLLFDKTGLESLMKVL